MKANTASLSASNNTDIFVHATKNLIIDTELKSKVFVYGNLKIELKGLPDRSRIIKKWICPLPTINILSSFGKNTYVLESLSSSFLVCF